MALHSMATRVAGAEGPPAPCPIERAPVDLGALAVRLNAQATAAGERGLSVLPNVLRGYADIAAALAADPEPLT